jgi:uncharacterized protein (DUF488 family)
MSDHGSEPARDLFSIGHSNHSLDRFLELLRHQQIEVVVDIRSEPYSKYSPHFGARELKSALATGGVQYVYLGRELGGRPDEEEYYDDRDHVDYTKLARSPTFLEGLERLLAGRRQYRVALLCSEEDPVGCHRHLLVGRVLAERNVRVKHIRGDGRVETEADLVSPQPTLGGAFEELGWKSIRPVSRRRQRAISSER